MTAEVLVIAVIRIAGSLPVLRWPLAGGLLAIAVDASDLLLRDVLDLGGVGDYQSLDKWLDQVYLALFMVVAWRWEGRPRRIAAVLYAIRMVGFVLFELTGERLVLLAFPNAFEFWFLLVAAVGPDAVRGWSRWTLLGSLIVVAAAKLVQEWAIHGAKLFDGISSIEFLELLGQRLLGG